MNTLRRRLLVKALQPLDLTLMTVCFAIAALPDLQIPKLASLTEFLSLRIKLQNALLFVALLCLWHIVFTGFGLYDSKRLSTRKAELVDSLKAVSLSTLCIAAVAIAFRIKMVTPAFLVVFLGSIATLTCASRLAVRTALRYVRGQGRNSRNMLIIGSNIRAIEFARNMEARPELGYRVLGFADEEWAGTETARKHGYSVLSDLDALPQYLRQNIVDEIVIALPMSSLYKHACRIAGSCEQQGIIVRVIPDLFNLRLAHVRTDGLDGAPITHSIVRNDTWGTIAKRVLDVTLSALAIMFLSPLLLLVALLIKLTSPGPVFFVQKRVGLNKRIFNIYKFRTMVVDAERKLQQVEHLNEVAGPVFKIKKDPRITPLGSFLRKTSIDELPQLFNVLHGDMSLVGPRPLQLRDYELFNKDCEDWQRCRFSVRPGITCLWQVNGRSSIPFEKWMELDLLYVHKWSLWLDLQILARTIPAVLRGLGAA